MCHCLDSLLGHYQYYVNKWSSVSNLIGSKVEAIHFDKVQQVFQVFDLFWLGHKLDVVKLSLTGVFIPGSWVFNVVIYH